MDELLLEDFRNDIYNVLKSKKNDVPQPSDDVQRSENELTAFLQQLEDSEDVMKVCDNPKYNDIDIDTQNDIIQSELIKLKNGNYK